MPVVPVTYPEVPKEGPERLYPEVEEIAPVRVTEKPLPVPPVRDLRAKALFNRIKGLSETIRYPDLLIPQLEGQYNRQAVGLEVDGYSLIGAALQAPNLDTMNKIILIQWLKKYGVESTFGDKELAKKIGIKLP